jgi:ribosomal protein S18 acetylase RimI-like enzyme
VPAAVTVTDCERIQAHWFRTRAEVLGGDIWDDGPLTWMRGADGMHLMFPNELPQAALARGVERARALGAGIGVWLNPAVDASPLARAGFERGWSPWWMTAPIAGVGPAGDPRVELQDDSADYTGEHADYRAELALARARPRHSWYAAAYTHPAGTRPAGHFAGRAWSHRAGHLAGVFDMAVWPAFRRRGLGTALLRAVSAAAGAAGATHAVLNATPEGELLYRRYGFVRIGEGITWWLHPER